MVAAAATPAGGRVMIRFTDAQIATLRELAAPLAPWQRREFLEIVAERLAGTEIGDGSVHAAALAAQREGLATRRASQSCPMIQSPAWFTKGEIDRLFGGGYSRDYPELMAAVMLSGEPQLSRPHARPRRA